MSFLSVKDYSWQTRVREYPIVEANEKLSNQGLYTWSMVIPGSPLAKTPYVYESNYALIKVPLTDAEYPIANLKDMNPATSWRASPKELFPITLIIGSSDSSVGLSYTGFPLSKGRIQNYRILGTHSEGIDTIASGSFENTNKEQFLFWPKTELYTEIKLEILNTTGGMPAIAELTLLKYSPDTVENAHDDGRFAEIADLNYPLITSELVPLFLKQRLSKPKGVSSYSLFRSDDQLKVKIKNRNYRLNGQVDLH